MSDRVTKYAAVQVGERLYQGEIVEGLIQVRQTLETIGANGPLRLDEIVHPFAIVMTQDCDLEQDFCLRSGGHEGPSRLSQHFVLRGDRDNGLEGEGTAGKGYLEARHSE